MATPIAELSAPFVFSRFTVPTDNPLTEETFALARHLFYDPILSGNNQVSCGTCHAKALAFTDGCARSPSLSGGRLEFSVMSLANLLWGQERFFWDGHVTSLEEQALIPIQHPDEMGQDIDALISVTSKPAHKGFFKVPTLRNIGVTAPYMHDGRFETLEAIIAFLHTLTDEAFLTNPKFSDPFDEGS